MARGAQPLPIRTTIKQENATRALCHDQQFHPLPCCRFRCPIREREVSSVGGSLSNSWSAGSACANVFVGASAKLAEYCRQLLDPIVSPSDTGIDIEGIGARLMRDGHAELNDGA